MSHEDDELRRLNGEPASSRDDSYLAQLNGESPPDAEAPPQPHPRSFSSFASDLGQTFSGAGGRMADAVSDTLFGEGQSPVEWAKGVPQRFSGYGRQLAENIQTGSDLPVFRGGLAHAS